MYRMFIKEQKKELIETVGRQGGGFIPAEIMVCQNFELAVPSPEERKYWVELCPSWQPHIAAASDLLEACKEQHTAIDLLFARLIRLDPTFFPSKSGQPWEATVKGKEAIDKAEGR